MHYVLWALLTGVLVLFYALAYRPQIRQLDALRSEVTENHEELEARRKQTSSLSAVALEVARLRQKLEQYKPLPERQNLPEFIRDMDQLSKQASLRNYSLTPMPPRVQPLYCETPVRIEFEGDFLEVCAFLRQTEQMPRLTRVRGMSLRPSKDNRPGEVQLRLDMNIYSETH